MIVIAALNYWRGRGSGEQGAKFLGKQFPLPKLAMLALMAFYSYSLYGWQIAIQLLFTFSIILYVFGTGEMMQGQHGKQQVIKWQTKYIYWLISKFTPLQGKLCGFYFNTILGIIQMVVNLCFGFSFFYLGFLFLGIVIYLSKHWNYAEFNMALLWAAIIIGAHYG
jgi:hypothetical protein